MSREGLLVQLAAHGIQIQEMKYGQNSVSVYKGTFQNFAAAIKIVTLAPGADHTQLEKECHSLMALSHPNILKLYDCFWEYDGVSYFFVLVTEWCEKDLGKDMKQRADNHFPWVEDELWKLTFELVSALSYMQEQDMSHRDIKPENIFLTHTKNVKLGDFGSARTFQSDIEFATVTGTPFYLSPKVREAFKWRNWQVVHNSFKSDVYSLGLTLLSLALLSPPQSLASEGVSDDVVQTVINTVSYSDLFKSMLLWMLSGDENLRCDFKALNTWLVNTAYQKVQFRVVPSCFEVWCVQCKKPVDLNSKFRQAEAVRLESEPEKHIFCSRECFRAFIDLGNVDCPMCGFPIPKELIAMHSQVVNRDSAAVPGAQIPMVEQLLSRDSSRQANGLEEAKEPRKSAESKALNGALEMPCSPIEEESLFGFLMCCRSSVKDPKVPKTTNLRERARAKLDHHQEDQVTDGACYISDCSCW